MRIFGFIPVFLILLTSMATAQSVPKKSQIFVAPRGGAFEGTLAKKSKRYFEVETALGTRRVAARQVGTTIDPRTIRERYTKKKSGWQKKPSLADHMALAQWCERSGLTSGLAEQLEAILKREPHNAEAWRKIKSLASAYRPAKRNTTPSEKSRWARKEVDLLFAGLKSASRVKAAILRERIGALPKDITLGPAVKFAKRGNGMERWISSQVLGDSNKVRRVKPLYVRALNDPAWEVREAAVLSLKRHDDGTTIGPFLNVLLTSERLDRRAYAAEALGLLGDSRAVPALIKAIKAPPGAAVGGKARVNLVSVSQIAYVKDFDVEVAQSAVIADPIVDIAQSGTVLDAAVVAVTVQKIRGVYGHALGRLTGRRFGASAAKWGAWYKAQKK